MRVPGSAGEVGWAFPGSGWGPRAWLWGGAASVSHLRLVHKPPCRGRAEPRLPFWLKWLRLSSRADQAGLGELRWGTSPQCGALMSPLSETHGNTEGTARSCPVGDLGRGDRARGPWNSNTGRPSSLGFSVISSSDRTHMRVLFCAGPWSLAVSDLRLAVL